MGTSTDAYLIYGINLGGEDDMSKRNFVKINGTNYCDSCRNNRDCDNCEEEHDQGLLNSQPYPNTTGISIICHCSGDFPMFIIGIAETEFCAKRGYPEEKMKIPEVSPKWDGMLKDFFKEHGLPYKKPGWILASYWG